MISRIKPTLSPMAKPIGRPLGDLLGGLLEAVGGFFERPDHGCLEPAGNWPPLIRPDRPTFARLPF